MTAAKRVTLVCDHGKCPRRFRAFLDDEPLKETRAAAHQLGWIYLPGHPSQQHDHGRRAHGPGNGRDLCPRHRHTP
jgi:hypothetical protein